MSTPRQQKLAQNIVQNTFSDKPLNKKDLLVSSGYSEVSAESSAKDIIEQKGVQEELALLGFSIEEADKTIAKLLKSEKEEIQIKASQEIYKRLSGYAPEKKINLNVSHSDSSLDALIEKIEYELDGGT